MSLSAARIQPVTTSLGGGVTAFVQGDGGWCLNNAGVVTGRDRVVVIDTAATVSRARQLRALVREVAGRRPVTLVNTHHHGDHFFGNCVFDEGVTIVAHQGARQEMIETGTGLQQLWPDVDWGEIELRLPNVTFEHAMSLHLGDQELRLTHVGPAHTTNDAVAWLPGPSGDPGEGVLFTGDVISNGVTPFVLMGSVSGSLRAAQLLRQFPAGRIVPGHGPVGGPELIDRTIDYLSWITEVARSGWAAGRPPLEQARRTPLGEFAGLVDSERLVGNLIRAYSELRGEPEGTPLDVVAAFGQMVEFHGRLPTCFA